MSVLPILNRFKGAYVQLTKGLGRFDFRDFGDPSDLILTGDHAFPLAMNSRGQVLMAASLHGKGRIVVLGHESYLKAFPALVENALIWLRGDKSKNLSVGIQKNATALVENLNKSHFKVKEVEAFSESPEVGVYVTDAYTVGADHKDLVEFMKAGGGVLIAGQAWSWSASHPKTNTLHAFKGNKVSGVAGIYFSDHQAEKEVLPVYPHIPSSWMTVTPSKDFEEDLELLLEGVSEIDVRGGVLFSEILVHGPLAFPIGTTGEGQTFLAGSYYGKGRVIVISHEGYIGRENMAKFWKNAIDWLAKGRQGAVGVSADKAFKHLSKSGIKCEKTNFRKNLSVYVCTAYCAEKEIMDFVAEGGGLLIGGQAWYWAQTNCGQSPATGFPGNKILRKMGLCVMGGTVKGGLFKAPVPKRASKNTYHFRVLLRRFADHVINGEALTPKEEKQLKKLGRDCCCFLDMKAHEWYSYAQVVTTLTEILRTCGMPQVNDSCPAKSPKDHMLLFVGTKLYEVCPKPDALLPYLVRMKPLTSVIYNQSIKITTTTAGWKEWISTGLYLSPGMKTCIASPAEMVNNGWAIQIGCQTDRLNHEELKRAPSVHAQFDITKEMMMVGNLWGGLIYLVTPNKTKVNGVEITVQMAVPAPYYQSGVTTPAEWALRRAAPSPWAELEFDNIILTVPSGQVRKLEHPEKLAEHWNTIMKAVADLAAKPHKFNRKERMVTDVQISHGLMHAGYPIMMHKPEAAGLVNVDFAKKQPLWGPIHELGHNQQRGCWEFPPHTTECTCNLWSVYVHEEVFGIKREKAHPVLALEKRNKRAKEYVRGGRNLSTWEMWVALETYLQLQEKFGWDALKKVFAAYQEMSKFPTKKSLKMNLYAETFSKTVGMNLVGFFQAWGWPIQAATEAKLSDLPCWSDHPMVQYG